MIRAITFLASLSLCFFVAFAGMARAQDDASVSFAGKRVTLFIGFSATGGIGYDTYGRVMAKYLGKYLPGHPTVVPENRPGAGSIVLANYLANAAPRDGTELAIIGRGVAMDRLINGERSAAQFEATKFTWLGSMNSEVGGFFISDTARVKNLQDVLDGRALVVGSDGAGSDLQTYALALNAVLGTRLTLIDGYPGTNELLLALEKGEVDGVVGYSWSAARTGSAALLADGKLKLILQLALKKHRDLPDVPLVMDLVRNADDKAVLELLFARQSMGRPFAAPPGLDPPLAAVLRRAFAAAMQDPDLIAECARLKLEINYLSGDDIAALVARFYAFSPQVVARAQKLVATN